MKKYYLTVFEKNGNNILDESFEAENDAEARKIGSKKLKEKGYAEYTHRCAAPEGHLILFHR
ncbi:YhzD family protein [Halobacillus sp. Marseille-P3879]|uniref:YhzD family protein n=1 Tax=Halobacillus TaxID=45667 RepID=UPI000C7D9316|nr:YhzD family protein [Halobacillus sp. Marseille-P3879]